MIKSNETAIKVAELLMQVKAIKLQPNQPFTWASGWKSPIYCDNRVTLSFPKIRNFIRQSFVEIITEHYGKPDLIAGVATGAIAHGVLVAQDLGLPFVYVRPEAKKHGLGNAIEGYFEPEQQVLIIEDLISTGNSSLKVVDTLREAGCKVKGMAAIFTYGFEKSESAFQKAKCPLVTLSDYNFLIERAYANNYLNDAELESLKEWRLDPENWGK